MAFVSQQIDEAEGLEDIINQDVDAEVKKSLVETFKQSSHLRLRKLTTLQTGLAMATTMMGTSILVLPILFFNNGIFTALIVSFIIAIISAKTTSLLSVHMKEDELDLPETLLRVLGKWWKLAYMYSNIVTLWFTGMIFQILIVNQLYPILELLLGHFNYEMAKQDAFTFKVFSYQWVGLIFSILIMPLFCLRKLGILVKLTSYGSFSIFAFVIFTITQGIINLTHHKPTEAKYLGPDFANLSGVFALALLIQAVAMPMLKNNMDQKKNNVAIAIDFLGLGQDILWLEPLELLQFVEFQSVMVLLVQHCSTFTRMIMSLSLQLKQVGNANNIHQILLFLKLSVVFPVLQYVTRSQFCCLVYGLEKPPNWFYYGTTVFYAATCLLAQCLNIDLTLLLGLTGYHFHIQFKSAVVGVYQEFIVPVALHLSCLYRSQRKVHMERIQRDIQADHTGVQDPFVQSMMDNPDVSQLKVEEEIKQEFKCNDHQELITSEPKWVRFTLYGIIVLIGFVVTITQLISIFK